jgi:hypothetical protein
MDQTLLYTPGQKVTIFLEVKNVDGYRTNSLTTPVVTRIFQFALVDGYSLFDGYLKTDGYQQPMTEIVAGLYFAQVTLPKMASSVGSYLVDVSYTDPISTFPAVHTYQIIVTAPFGNFGTMSG